MENKSDNLIDNLQLELVNNHNQITILVNQNKRLKEQNKALIYLWTRDSEMPVSKETENYITDHLQKIKKSDGVTFSDKPRIDMVTNILKNLPGNIKAELK